jgi:hypothetical protein
MTAFLKTMEMDLRYEVSHSFLCFHPIGVFLFPSLHFNRNYKLQFLDFQCLW